ncbi:non-heme iron oxygenase ferredoxin subunit [Neorhizobium petrolearium]
MNEIGTLTKLCNTADVSKDLPFRAEIDGFAYAIFQAGDQYYVTADLCSHGPGQLSDGFLEGCEVECPFHQGRFDVRTGAPTAPPCEIPIMVWTPVIRDEAVFIDVAAPRA